MHPFFHIGSFALPAYGTMMFLGAVAAYGLLALETRKTPLWNDAFNYYFMALVGALAGAFLLYALVTLPSVIAQWDTLIKPLPFWEGVQVFFQSLGGFVFYGGLIGAMVAMFIYAKAFKTPLLPYMDLMAPIVPVIHAIGRIGCFLGGCCYGMPVAHDHPLAVVYPAASLAAPAGEPLLALPLIETAINLLIAVCLYAYKRRRPKAGVLSALYLMAYALCRFVLEFFRGDLVRGVYWGISTSQLISIGLLAIGIVLSARALKRSS